MMLWGSGRRRFSPRAKRRSVIQMLSANESLQALTIGLSYTLLNSSISGTGNRDIEVGNGTGMCCVTLTLSSLLIS